MKKIIERLLTFIIGIPAIFTLVYFLPYYNHLALNIAVIFFSGLGALELSSMFEKKLIHIPKIESFIIGTLTPLAVTLYASFNLPQWIIPAVIMTGAFWSLLSRIFCRKIETEKIINHITGCFALLIYPGFFMSWLVLMGSWGNTAAILLFLFISFGNDSFAWLFGTLFGKNNRGVIKVSPNKSIAGYAGGIFGSILVAIIVFLIFPSQFPFHSSTVSGITGAASVSFSSIVLISLILGFCTGAAASIGDLAESAIKRSCDFKDSGNFMLGRGGILDSIDSIAVAAPVFFFLFKVLFNV